MYIGQTAHPKERARVWKLDPKTKRFKFRLLKRTFWPFSHVAERRMIQKLKKRGEAILNVIGGGPIKLQL